jgi:serpin B
MKKVVILAMVVTILASGLLACSVPPVSGSELKSEKQRVTSPGTSDADLEKLVEGNSDFAFDLYRVLRNEKGNIFYSPYSISLALAMTYGGARGDTERQMADAMRFLLSQDRLHPAFNSLDLILASRGEPNPAEKEEGFRLHIANSIWGQRDFPFLDEYLDLLAENYGAGLRVLDFMKDPELARATINDWVSEQTEQKIKDLIPEGVIDSITRLVLANAIYFNAAWEYPFDEENTYNGDFFLVDSGKVTVPMMHQTESFGYAEGDGYRAVELPYDGRELSMVIIIPDKGGFETFEASLNSELVNDIIEDISYTEVELSMPKFSFDSSFGLKEALKSLGMENAFIPSAANLSGMDGRQDLFIQDVVHKAYVSVDEAGTEAAAATGVIVGLTAIPEITRVDIDSPFIFLIRDIETGTMLFIGRVLNPGF